LLLAATVRSFAHMPLGISDHNTDDVYWHANASVNLQFQQCDQYHYQNK